MPFLIALSQLDEAASFLSKHKSGLVAAAEAAESIAALRSDGNALALREFEATMKSGYYHPYYQRQQQQGLVAAEATARTTGTTTTTTTATAATQQTRLRSLARALVAGGGPEASSPSVLAFLGSEKEARR